MGSLGQCAPAHFILVPFVAHGHLIPMMDVARILAGRGARVSFITTPANSARIQAMIGDDVKASALPIEFVELHNPRVEDGLPEGRENADLLDTSDRVLAIFETNNKLQAPLERYLLAQQQQQKFAVPTCMITDYCNYWTVPVAQKLRVPRLIFHGPGCMYALSLYLMQEHKIYDRITDVFEPFVIPGFPHKFEMNMFQMTGVLNFHDMDTIRNEMWNAELSADGVVVNSFDDFEGDFIECYKKEKGKPVWAIGPLSLYNKDINSKAARGSKASMAVDQVLGWLEKRKPSSVLYVSFGSTVINTPAQLMEIGSGLEGSKVPFIWAIRDNERTEEVEKWLSDGFEERVFGRGLLIKGWAPQAAILSHPAVGGFMTHCGWNSIIEAISEGLPMVTWPRYSDQFMNEKLVVEVLKIGLAIRVASPVPQENETSPEIVRKDVEDVVLRLMDEGQEGNKRREMARELGQKAKEATEDGGSSHANISKLIKFATNGGIYQ